MQYTSLPDGFTIQELDASHLEQFNALLRYAFQVTEEELVQVLSTMKEWFGRG